MLVYRFVGTGPLRKVDTRECISRKNEPWGSLYNDKKSEKKQRLEKFRPLHVINDNSYCIDYILMLVNKYHDTHCEDKEILITIRKAVDSSPELRSKKALIENFINGVNEIDDVMNEWHDYVVEMREHDLQIIIEEERLKPVETRKFLENAFQEGEVKTVGTDIDKILPPVSRFGGGNRAVKKKTVIDRLMAYFEKFYGIGGNGGFIDKTEEE